MEPHFRFVDAAVWMVVGTGVVCAVVRLVEHDIKRILHCWQRLSAAIRQLRRQFPKRS
jgi:hypothetical protein